MQFISFIKKLQIFDIFWGRRSKIFHGINDGGAKAIAIADPDVAIKWQNRSIFNVNNLGNECQGGHYHAVDFSKLCFPFEITDWVNNQIEIIATGIPVAGQIGPHQISGDCFDVAVWQDIGARGKEVQVQVFVDKVTKNIILKKTPRNHFKGHAILEGVKTP